MQVRYPAPASSRTIRQSSRPRTRYSKGLGYPAILGVRKARQYPKPTFRFKVDRGQLGIVQPPRTYAADNPPNDEFMVINGRLAQSKNEWYLYKALLTVGVPAWAIQYQVPWHGGREMGGQVLDFVLDLGGAPVVIRVMGQHWHPTAFGSPLDTFTGNQMRNEGLDVKDIPDTRLKSIDDSISALKHERLA